MEQKITIKVKKSMILDDKPIKEFEELQIKLKKVIKVYNTEKKALYTYLGMARTTFDRKLKDQHFTIAEMYSLCEFYKNLQNKVDEKNEEIKY